MSPEISEIQEKLKTELNSHRYEHTLGVMYTAGCMAMRYGEEVEKALLAGLLHDCAKCISIEEKLELCKQYQLEMSHAEKNNPELIHAKLGVKIAKDKYHIEDEDILNAISSHTTGRPDMSLLEKIIYIADFMEPGRKNLPNMKDVRRLAFEDIDKCLFRILKDSLVYFKSKNFVVDPMTEKTYNYYKETLGMEE